MMVHMKREYATQSEALELSLNNPHSESFRLAEAGIEEWIQTGRSDDEGLVDVSTGWMVHWKPGEGWVENDG